MSETQKASPAPRGPEAQAAHTHADACGCGHDHHDHHHHHGHAHHTPVATFVRGAPKVGRNDPCPCGSGKKHKKCCLETA
jgi:uncharacterized protein YecA (UPF0149 family)